MTATDPQPAVLLTERLAPAGGRARSVRVETAGPEPAPSRWAGEEVEGWTASCPNRLQHMNPAHAEHDIS